MTERASLAAGRRSLLRTDTKRAFAFLIGMFDFIETGKAEVLPLVAIPAQ
jgi:hypothetical protein